MPGYTYASGQVDDGEQIMDDIVNILRGNAGGITGQPVWFNRLTTDLSSSGRKRVLLESTPDVDPVQNDVASPSQAYRLLIEGQIISGIMTECTIYWGSRVQIPDINTVDADTPFIKLWDINSYPRPNRVRYFYRITVTNRGFAFYMHPIEAVNDIIKGSTALVIQRPVNPKTGEIRNSGRIPIFVLALSWLNGPGNEMMCSVLREIDIDASSPQRQVSAPSYFSLYKNNMSWNHPNILSNLTHVIKIPFGLATDRHIYMEEMDLCAFVHAGSFIHSQNIQIDTYSGSVYAGTRTYTGGFGYVDYNFLDYDRMLSGARLLILTQAPGPGGVTDITNGNA